MNGTLNKLKSMEIGRDLMKIKLVKDKAPFKAPIQIYTEGDEYEQ